MITILSSPTAYGGTMSPVYSQDGHNLTYVLDSDNRALCQMKYVTDVYVNGSTSIAQRIRLSPNAKYGRCTVTINRILADYLSFDYFPGMTGPMNCPNSIVYYSTAFGEESDGTYGCNGFGFVVNSNLAYGSTGTSINACIQYDSDYDWSNYLVTNGSTASQFLTNAPTAQVIGPSENSYLYFGNRFTGGGTAPGLRVTRRQISGAINEFYVVNLPPDSDVRITAYGVGPFDLNLAATSGSVLDECGQLAESPIIDCNTDYYDVCIADIPTIWPC